MKDQVECFLINQTAKGEIKFTNIDENDLYNS